MFLVTAQDIVNLAASVESYIKGVRSEGPVDSSADRVLDRLPLTMVTIVSYPSEKFLFVAQVPTKKKDTTLPEDFVPLDNSPKLLIKNFKNSLKGVRFLCIPVVTPRGKQ